MLAEERQRKIGELLRQQGAVHTSDLVNLFHVSIETIRKDLVLLEQQGLLSRVHGGAIRCDDMSTFVDLSHRTEKHMELKKELAMVAAAFVQEEDTIAIDAGSTAVALAEVLCAKFTRLTIITHSTDVFDLVKNKPGYRIILCGGEYAPREKACYGLLTLEMYQRVHVHKCFLFPTAVSFQYGICDYVNELAIIQKQMMASADEVFILADSSKFEKKALIRLDQMSPRYTYITDSHLPQELLQMYTENGIRIYGDASRKEKDR